MKTLMITGDTEKAWERLGEPGLYGDNGGDPDGNAWLPSQFVTKDEAAEVLAAGLGEMVKASWLDDDEVAKVLSIEDVLALAESCNDWEAMQNAVEDRVRCWAHYNAYGAGDSLWIIVRL